MAWFFRPGVKKNPLLPVKRKGVFKPKISKQNYTGEAPLAKAAIQQQMFAQRAVILFGEKFITEKVTPNVNPESREKRENVNLLRKHTNVMSET